MFERVASRARSAIDAPDKMNFSQPKDERLLAFYQTYESDWIQARAVETVSESGLVL